MRCVASKDVWAFLTRDDRDHVVEEIVRILTEEVDNERFNQDPANSLGATGHLCTCVNQVHGRL